MSLKRSFYDISYVLTGYTANFLLSLAILFILARNLGPARYGIYTLFLLVGNIFFNLTNRWIMQPAVIRFGKEEFIKTKGIRSTFQAQALILPLALLASSSVLYLLRERVADFIGWDGSLVFYLILYFLIFSLFFLFQQIFQALSDFKTFGFFMLARNALFFSMISVVLILNRAGLTLQKVILFCLISYSLLVLLSFLKLKNMHLLGFVKQPKIYNILAYSWPYVFSCGAALVLEWIDKFFIRVFMTSYEVGIYALASLVALQLLVVPQMLFNVIFPLIVSYRVAKKRQNIKIFVERIIPQISIFICGIALIGIASSGLLTVFAGPEYRYSMMPFVILIAANAATAVKTLYLPVIMAFDYGKFVGIVNAIGAVVNIVLVYFMIKLFGIIGVAIATLLAFSLTAFLAGLFVSREFKIKTMHSLYWVFSVFVAAGGWLVIQSYFIRIALFVAIIYISYLLIKKTGVFKKEDLEIFDRIDLPPAIKAFLAKAYAFLG